MKYEKAPQILLESRECSGNGNFKVGLGNFIFGFQRVMPHPGQ